MQESSTFPTTPPSTLLVCGPILTPEHLLLIYNVLILLTFKALCMYFQVP